MELLKFIIPGTPRSKKNSPRIVKLGGRYVPIPSKQYKDYEASCINALSQYKDRNLEGPLEVTCIYHMKLNKDGSIPKQKLDLTNLLEATDDIICHKDLKIVKDDTCQIIASHDGSRIRFENCEPYTEVFIKEFKE